MAMTTVANILGAPKWDEGLWEELLAYTEAGIVVPIIGSASYPVEIDGRPMTLDGYLAARLGAKLSLPPAAAGPGVTLNDVVSAYLRGGGRRERLYPTVATILHDAALTLPTALKQLAEISHFNLFVTTGFDPMLETAINQVRFGGVARTRTVAYAPNNKQDLPPAGSGDDDPIVYHLFGKASALPNSYAISDEDLIEFLHALQSESRRPENLLGRLENANLLLIGGNFPDWVARIFLRTTKGRRLSDSRPVLEYLAENHSAREPGLITFLTNFSPKTQIFHGETEEFIESLWQRWHARNGALSNSGTAAPQQWGLPAEMPHDAIFISYAREDLVAVRALKEALNSAGLTVWFDFERVGAGEAFDLKVQNSIRRCSLFLPVLSRNTQARREGFFRREWRYALDRDLDIDPAQPFIVPVAIDDTVEVAMLPKRFREINLTAAPQGRPNGEFIAQLKKMSTRP